MSSDREDYLLYKEFLEKFRPYYNIFYLSDLIHWIREEDRVFFNAEQIKKKWKEYIQLIKDEKVNDILNFYIHIPFCRSKCSYCMYYSKPLIEKELENYINRLIKETNFFKETFSGVEFSSLYIGGGTPSILSERQINKLFTHLFNSFKFRKDGEKTFESNPESTNLKKLMLLKKFGFNRVSFGVQNLDTKVLSFANRDYQIYDSIQKTVKSAKKLGFEVNTDLMIGLKGDSIKTIINSFIKLTKITPASITLYSLKPPEEYLKKYFRNDYYLFNSNLYRKARKIRQILQSMEVTLNYYIHPGNRDFEIFTSADPNYLSKDFKESYKCHYDYSSPLSYSKPSSLFALGTRASSYIFKFFQYHDAAIGQETVDFDPNVKKYWSFRFNLKDEMVYYILKQLSCRLCFSQREFRTFFNVDFKDNFKSVVNSLKKLNKIKFDGDLVFLPSEPLERYTCALFFLNRRDVFKKVNNFFSKI